MAFRCYISFHICIWTVCGGVPINPNSLSYARCAMPGCAHLVMNTSLPFCSNCWFTYSEKCKPMPPWMRFLKRCKDKERYDLTGGGDYRRSRAFRFPSLERMAESGNIDMDEVEPYRGINVVRKKKRRSDGRRDRTGGDFIMACASYSGVCQ